MTTGGVIPDRALELEILSGLGPGGVLAGVDEVGRGSLAGPVSVGIALVDADAGQAPDGLRDSKRMTPAARERMAPKVRSWALDVAVGHAGPDVVDGRGVIAALRWAARDALDRLRGPLPDAVLLDGRHNWWADGSLFDLDSALPHIPVHMRVRADASCSAVAAASVVAKVERDAMMVALDERHPGYDWARNKGYASPAHIRGLARLGPSAHHRTSWHLPGVTQGEAT